MDKRKKLISLASGVAGLVLVASVIVLAQFAPGASSSKPNPTVTVTVTPDALADQKPKTEGDPSRPDISASEFDTPQDTYSFDGPALPDDSFDLVSDPDFPAAKNKMELKFFKVAQESCLALRKTGAKLSFSNYTYALIALDSKGNYTGNLFDAKGYFIESFFGMDTYPPAVCEPSENNEHFDHASESLAYNFLVETTDEVGYVWHAHHGSSQLSSDQFVVRDGKVVSVVSDGYFGSYDVRYGLNKLEKESALKTY